MLWRLALHLLALPAAGAVCVGAAWRAGVRRGALGQLTMAAPTAAGSAPRGLDLLAELASRAGFGRGPRTTTPTLKREVLDALAPHGDPAQRVPASVALEVDALCRQLEQRNPISKPATQGIQALNGRWRVRYSDAPPPSNGALGPFVGEAYQMVDVYTNTYSNQLVLLGGLLDVTLCAEFTASSDSSLRVMFRTITATFGGLSFPSIRFPDGTERTWLLTYTDDDFRVVRAGVDGGRSTARNVGLISKDEGQAADSYLFVLTRAPTLQPSSKSNAEISMLKTELLVACEGQRKGAASDASVVSSIGDIMQRLEAVSALRDTASSDKLVGTWDIVWTTEAELLTLTDKGFLGLPCESASQTISRTSDGTYRLDNSIDFDGGFLKVGSTCEPSATGGKVNFRFESCEAKWKDIKVPLPPVGAGWFEVMYIDDDIRCCRDSRGDLQICTRRKE